MATLATLYVNLTARTASFEAAMARTEKQMARLGRRTTSIGRNITMGLSVPLGIVGVASGKMAMDFESSMSKIVGLVGVAEKQVGRWKGEILKIAPALGKTPKEMADAMFFITSAGLRGETALRALANTARASAAGLGDMTSIADAVTSAMNAYGQSNMDSARATGILVAAIREGKLAAETLSPVLGRLLPLSAQLDVSFGETAGALAAMSKIGLNASESATALQGVLKQLVKPAEASAKVLKEKFNISFEDLRRVLKEEGVLGMLEVLAFIMEKDEAALAKVFPRVEGLVGVLSLLGKNADEAARVIASVGQATGVDLTKAFDTAAKTAEFKFNQALSVVQVNLIQLGQVILPLVVPWLDKLVKIIAAAARWFDELNPRTQKFIVISAGIVTVLGPAIMILGMLTTAISALIPVVSAIGAGLALLLSPLALLGAAVGTAAYLWITRWEEIKTGTIAIVTFLSEEIPRFFREMFEGIGIIFSMGKEAILGYVTGIKDDVITIFQWMSDIVVGGSIVPDMIDKMNEHFERGQTKTVKTVDKMANQVASEIRFMASQTASSMGEITASLFVGEMSFSKFVESTMAMIAKLILQIILLKTVGAGLGGAFGMGVIGGIFGGGLQHGGRTRPGEGYWVGEGGPEWFAPDIAGSVIPMPALAGAGGFAPRITFVQHNAFHGIQNDDVDGLMDKVREATENGNAKAFALAKEQYRTAQERSNAA